MDLSAEQLEQMDEQVKQQFGLRLNPFSAAVTAFYDGAQRRHSLETLRHLGIFGDMILFLTGEGGAGKTRLLEEFSRLYSDEVSVLMLSAYAGATKQSCLTRLAILSGLATIENEPAHQTLSRLIQKYDMDCQQSGKRTVWAIDDAEQLSEPELKLFLNAFNELSPDSGVVLLLAGSSELVANAKVIVPHECLERFHQVMLKPLIESETLEYLTARLQFSGFQGVLELNAEQRERLMSMSKGLPGHIHQSFLRAMFDEGDNNDGASDMTRNMSQNILFGITALLLLSFIFVSYQHGLFSSSSDEELSVQVESIAELERQRQLEERDRAAEQAAERLAMLDKALAEQGESSVSLPIPETRSDVTESGAVSEIADDVEVQESEEPVAAVVTAPVQQEIDKPQESGADVQAAKVVKEESVVEEESVEKQDAFRHNGFRSAAWVKDRAGFYTLQVLGSYNEVTAQKFVDASSASKDDVFYIESRYKDKPWFVVLYGSFESKVVARNSLAAAPLDIRKQKPWLRSYAAIIETLP